MNTTTKPKVSQHQSAMLTMVLVSNAMIVIDNSIVITGLPAIRAGLGFSTVGLSWVQNAYALAFGGLMLLGARAGDPRRRRSHPRAVHSGLAVHPLF